MAPPICPDCSSRKVRPIIYGEPSPELAERAERREVVLGGCLITGHDPAWDCADCTNRFGEAAESGTRLRSRTRGHWVQLIRTMLPKPVKTNEQGELVGGKPPIVAVRVSKDAIDVLEAAIDWPGVHPVWKPRPFATATFDMPASAVAALIAGAWSKRIARYRWCPRCRRTVEPEYMMESKCGVCHPCASKYLGVLF